MFGKTVKGAPSAQPASTLPKIGQIASSSVKKGAAGARSSYEIDALAKAAAKRELQTQERNLLEELYDDKTFLEELAADTRFMSSAYPDGPAAAVPELVMEGIDYLQTRVEFWRQRNPCAAHHSELSALERNRPAGAKRRSSSTLQAGTSQSRDKIAI